MQYGFYFDSSKCGSCKACVMACKDKNNDLVGRKNRNVIDFSGGTWVETDGIMAPDGVFSYSISLSCNHCSSPICVANCPTGAMQKRSEDGIVFVDKEVCIGCKTCEATCPYGAPTIKEEEKKMHKCDFCMDYLAEGGRPACVDACLMRCLDFGDIEDLRSKYGNVAEIAPMPSASETSPNIVIVLNDNAGKDGSISNSPVELL